MADYIFSVAGNIGAGKSTWLKAICEKYGYVGVPEAFDNVFADLFYNHRQNPHEGRIITELFEGDCLHKRMGRHLKAKVSPGIFGFDRTMIEGFVIFALNSNDEGYLTSDAQQRLKNELDRHLDHLGRTKNEQPKWMEQFVIYLEVADTKKLYDRIMLKRKRPEEQSMLYDYLDTINNRYKWLYDNHKKIYSDFKVDPPYFYKVDASVDFEENPQHFPCELEKAIAEMQEMMEVKT